MSASGQGEEGPWLGLSLAETMRSNPIPLVLMLEHDIEQRDAVRIAYLIRRYNASLREISHSKSIVARAFRELRFISERINYLGGQDGVLIHKGETVDTTNVRHLNDALSTLARQMGTRHELEATLKDEGLQHLVHPPESPPYASASNRFHQ